MRNAKRDDRPWKPIKKPAKKKAPVAVVDPLKMPKIRASVAMAAKQKPKREHPFHVAQHPPSVFPDGKSNGLAMDDQAPLNAALNWAIAAIASSQLEGLQFLGYPYLAELAQRPEYRRISETLAVEMTRKWIKFGSASQEADKTDKIKELEDEMKRLRVRSAFKELAEQDGFFGRSHLFIDLGVSDDRDELKTPIGTGAPDDKISNEKVTKGKLKKIKVIEPVWCYPTSYNSSDPLTDDWYNPTAWFVQGKEVHSSRLMTFVGREVPDLLKPSYSFGGLALTQMALPYVNNWLRTRQSVADIIHSFSVFVLSTDLSTLIAAEGDELLKRADLFNDLRDNKNLMMLNKATEDFKNVSASLASLDVLQAQTQEHMAAVSGIPLVKLLGISPTGLNASSEGEIRVFYDWILAYQESFFTEKLTKVIHFIMRSLWGAVDGDITFSYEPLWALSEKEISEMRKAEADTHCAYVDRGIIDKVEVRQALASDPDSIYQGLDADDVPEPPEEPEPKNVHESERDDITPGAGTKAPDKDDGPEE